MIARARGRVGRADAAVERVLADTANGVVRRVLAEPDVAVGGGVRDVALRDELVHREPVAPALAHRVRLLGDQSVAEAVVDEPVGQAVRVLVVDDRRVVGRAHGRVGEQVHLHARAEAVRRRAHVRVVEAARVVGLGKDRIAAARTADLEVVRGVREADRRRGEPVVERVDEVVQLGGRLRAVGRLAGARRRAAAPRADRAEDRRCAGRAADGGLRVEPVRARAGGDVLAAAEAVGRPDVGIRVRVAPVEAGGSVSGERFIHCGSAARSTVWATPLGPGAPGWLSNTVALLTNCVREWRASTRPLCASTTSS